MYGVKTARGASCSDKELGSWSRGGPEGGKKLLSAGWRKLRGMKKKCEEITKLSKGRACEVSCISRKRALAADVGENNM